MYSQKLIERGGDLVIELSKMRSDIKDLLMIVEQFSL